MSVDEALVPAQVIEDLTTPMRLIGVTRRHNVQVPADTLALLRDVDKKLATTRRPVVSRNALLAMAAQRVTRDGCATRHREPRAVRKRSGEYERGGSRNPRTPV